MAICVESPGSEDVEVQSVSFDIDEELAKIQLPQTIGRIDEIIERSYQEETGGRDVGTVVDEDLMVRKSSMFSTRAMAHMPSTMAHAVTDIISRGISEVFTQPRDREEDPELCGIALHAFGGDIDARFSETPEAYIVQTRAERLLTLARQVPWHLITEMRFYIAPLLCASAGTALVCIINQIQCSYTTSTGTMHELLFDEDLPLGIFSLRIIVVFSMSISFWAIFVSFGITMWRWRRIMAPLSIGLVGFVSVFVVGTSLMYLRRSMVHAGRATIAKIIVVSLLIPLILPTIFFWKRLGDVTNNPHLAKGMVIPFCSISFISWVMNVPIVRNMMYASELSKIIFAVAVYPLLYEILVIFPLRVTARSIINNHPSTSFLIVSMGFTSKHVNIRNLVALMSTRFAVTVASIANAVGEIVFRTTLVWREGILYRLVFGRFLPSTVDPQAQQRNTRHKDLRMHNSMYESLSDFVCTWSSCVLIVLCDVDLGGKARNREERITFAVVSALIQTASELATDLISIFILDACFDIKLLLRSHARKCYWPLPSLALFFYMALIVAEGRANFFCRAPELNSAPWVFCLDNL